MPSNQLDGASNDGSPSTTQTAQQPEGNRIKITPTASASVPERPRSTGPSPAQTTPPAKLSPQSIEDFEHQALGNLLNISLKEDGHRISLPGLRSELQDEGKELRLHTGILDQAILEAASKTEKQRPLDYLLPCWNRIQERMKRPDQDTRRWEIYCEAKRLCLSYCIFAITMPEMFGCENISHLDYLEQGMLINSLCRIEPSEESPLARQLLLSPDDNLRRGITPEFLKDISGKFDEDDSLKPALIAAVEELSAQLSSKDANGDFQPYFTVRRFPFPSPQVPVLIATAGLEKPS